MDGSNGNIVALLERIANQLVENQAATDKALATTNAAISDIAAGQERLRVDLSSRLDDTNSRLDATNSRLDGTNKRIDGVLAIIGGHHADHEQRIQVLEQRVLGKSR